MTTSAAGPGPEKFAGCLIGQSLGDVLGFVVEGQPPDACRVYVDGVVKGGRAAIIERRQKINKLTIHNRRLNHQRQAA
ncbi:MAG TPA: hypothetical protein QGG32_01770 [Rhodospirillales bacterium]|jgi:ADP-ribosylglycohydrolase|nr:hypothetical protein [Rhodospirillales bacterium]